MEKINIGDWHTKFRPDYDHTSIFEDCADKDLALFSLSFFLLVSSFPLLDQPYRKKTGKFFMNLQKKFFKGIYNKNQQVEQYTLIYSLLLLSKKFQELEKFNKNNLEKLVLYSVSHYACLLELEDNEYRDLLQLTAGVFKENYKIIKSKKSGFELIEKLYESFELNIYDDNKNRKNISLLTVDVAHVQTNINFLALNKYRQIMKVINKYK